jgi:hypothetical protein
MTDSIELKNLVQFIRYLQNIKIFILLIYQMSFIIDEFFK